MSNAIPSTLIAVMIAVILFACFLIGYSRGSSWREREAIKHGAAEWIVIDEEGNTEFRWKTKADCP